MSMARDAYASNEDRFCPRSGENGRRVPRRHDGRLLAVLLAAPGRGRTGPGPSSPTASASRCAPCAATSTACAQLGYPVVADTGVAGGYRLGVGRRGDAAADARPRRGRRRRRVPALDGDRVDRRRRRGGDPGARQARAAAPAALRRQVGTIAVDDHPPRRRRRPVATRRARDDHARRAATASGCGSATATATAASPSGRSTRTAS